MVNVAREVTPFSWLVDYVLGVGDWIETFTADTGALFVEGSISRLQEVYSAAAFQCNPDTGIQLQAGFAPGRIQGKAGRFNREVMSTGLAPPPLPVLRNRLGITQMANVAAVLNGLASAGRNLRV